MKQNIATLCLGIFLTSSLMATAFASGSSSTNISRRNYSAKTQDSYNTTIRWATGEYSNLIENPEGYLRVEYISGNSMTIEQYDESFQYLSKNTSVAIELDEFVDFYQGDDHYYLLFSASNTAESDSVEVVRVVKYDKSWNRLDDCSIFGVNTSGEVKTADMAEYKGNLLIHTCHQMYKSSDGVNHQANMHFTVQMDSMELKSQTIGTGTSYSGYVSHSFNQYIDVSSDGFIVTADHGDAYPRTLVLFSWKDQIGTVTASAPTEVDVFDLYGTYSQFGNTTGARIGGLEVGSSAVMLVGSSVSQNSSLSSNKDFNVFVATVPRNSFSESKSKVTYITDYDGNTYASNPFLVEVSEDKFILLWNEYTSKTFDTLCWTELNGSGEQTGSISKGTGTLSEVQPLVNGDGNLVWYTTLNSAPVFYELDLSTGEVFSSEGAVAVSGVTLDKSTVTLGLGETSSLVATVSPTTATETGLSWTSSNQSVATVDQKGTITGQGEGSATITVTTDDGGKTATCSVTVSDEKVSVTSITLDQSSLSLSVGATSVLTATVSPSNASDTSVNWTSSDTDIATVNSTGRVIGKAEGSVTITASTTDGNKTASCLVTVTPYEEDDSPEEEPEEETQVTYTNTTKINTTGTSIDGGSLTLNNYTAQEGTQVRIYAQAKTGFQLAGITVTGANGSQITVSQNSGYFYFTQPASNTTVEVNYSAIVDQQPSWENPYVDVNTGDWYYNSVQYVDENNLMSGVGDSQFAPDDATLRGMLVAILYNLADRPSHSGYDYFTDVYSDDYFSAATTWAKDKGIVSGAADTTFAPYNPVSREELVIILYGFEKTLYGTPEFSWNVYNTFSDKNTINVWASEATAWAASNGLVNGRPDGSFDPFSPASRGEIATILSKYASLSR